MWNDLGRGVAEAVDAEDLQRLAVKQQLEHPLRLTR
jgi:hypothetical protein